MFALPGIDPCTPECVAVILSLRISANNSYNVKLCILGFKTFQSQADTAACSAS